MGQISWSFDQDLDVEAAKHMEATKVQVPEKHRLRGCPMKHKIGICQCWCSYHMSVRSKNSEGTPKKGSWWLISFSRVGMAWKTFSKPSESLKETSLSLNGHLILDSSGVSTKPQF